MNELSQAMKKAYSQLSPDPNLVDRIQQAQEKRNHPPRRILALKPILATGLVTLLLVVSSGFLLRLLLDGHQFQPTQTTSTTQAYLWPALSLTEGVSMADHIIYGRVTDKQSSGSETLVTIAVIQVLKTSTSVPADLEEITYYEIPPAADGTAYDIPPVLTKDQLAVLFLNRHSRALTPDFIIPVHDGRTELTSFLKQHSVFADLEGNPSIEAFFDQVLHELNTGN